MTAAYPMVPGRLYGVGVGPGDPELITRKAARLIAEADVVAYHAGTSRASIARAIADELIAPGTLEEELRYPVTTGIVEHPAGYHGWLAEFYESCAARLAVHLEAGRTVVVLAEGDPMFYGSFMYLHDRLADRFPTEVVPGVTALSGATAVAAQTLSRHEDVLTVLPGTLPVPELARRLADTDAAIDNTTRKLMASGGRPKSVGFWFAMGHSGMVFVLTALMALGTRAAVTLTGDDSKVHVALSTAGTLVSGGFLFLIGALNLVALVGIWRVFREMRTGSLDEHALERHLDSRGFIARLLGRVGRSIRHPWQMLPLGMLFGLGFDTASEVALLVLAGTGAAAGLPWYAVLVLPLLFAAGMSLLDFLDGVFMTVAYDWAFAHPVRKIYYNLSITGLSVAVAFVIGSIELLSVLHERFGLDSWATNWVTAVDLGSIGFVVVGLFVVVWAVAVSYWRLARVEERWATTPDPG